MNGNESTESLLIRQMERIGELERQKRLLLETLQMIVSLPRVDARQWENIQEAARQIILEIGEAQ